jgi:hypothetical protein
MLNEKIFTIHDAGKASSLAHLCEGLLKNQRTSWPECGEGSRSLETARYREIRCDGFTVLLQFNPLRMASTGAQVDPDSVRKRACFLCVENLPPEQTGILYEGKFMILCNPAPIFSPHYTISTVRHQPQKIEGSERLLLSLAEDLSGDYTIIYNGPRCGASAPDHLHFQAVPAGSMPVEREIDEERRRKYICRLNDADLYRIEKLGRAVLLLEGDNTRRVEAAMVLLLDAMKKSLPDGHDEPMMNLLCHHNAGGWRVTVFPRRKHRPDAFCREGDDRIIVSPGAVDLGGLLVTPQERDFLRLDAQSVQSIYGEVSMDEEGLDNLLSALK